MTDFSGKRVTVVGLARSGQAAAKLLKQLGARVKVSDQGQPNAFPSEFLQWLSQEGVGKEFGGHSKEFILDSDLVIISPGVHVDALPLQWAREQAIPVWSEIELAAQLCLCPIIAVTGSNGKTTTVTLISEILKAAGKNVRLCGNVGTPFSQYVLELKPQDYVVLEISSFQLETIVTFRPKVAVLINFSQNHLDRHRDLDEYFNAKCRIFMNQGADDFAVLNAGDEKVCSLQKKLKSQVFFFNYPGHAAEEQITNPNYLAAAQVARILGIPREIYQKVFAEFRGVEHRLEKVRTLDGIEYINDSKATTVESGRWALENLERPVIMICGGEDKKLDYVSLRDLVHRKVKHMVVIGKIRQQLAETFGSVVPVTDGGTEFRQAIERARSFAQQGDCVLLSPMTSSFDMFKNYEERGRIFKEIVGQLS